MNGLTTNKSSSFLPIPGAYGGPIPGGDYWVLNLRNNKLKQLGEGLPEASLMFTKFDAGDKRVSYVSGHNVYVEEVSSGQRTAPYRQRFRGPDQWYL
jgi:hypothetical protein